MHEKTINGLVSVVVPSKNRPDFLKKAVKSVCSQSYRPLELIVIDDASDTPVTLDNIITDEQFSYQILRNELSQGVAAARNKGIVNARGQWVAFLDDDDEWLETKISQQVEILLNNKEKSLKAISCHLLLQDDDGNELGVSKKALTKEQLISNILYADNNLEPSTLIVERTVFDEIGLYKVNFPTAEDREWLLRFLTKYNISVIDKPLVYFTQHCGERLTRNHQAMMKGEELFLEQVRLHVTDLGGNYKKAVGYRYAKIAHESILAGKQLKALKNYFKSIVTYPFDYRSLAGFCVALLGKTLYRRILSLRMPRLR